MKDFNINQPDQDSFDPEELNSIGVKFIHAGQFEEAIHFFDLYLSINPWNALVISNKADACLGLKRLDEARDLEYYALTLNPELAIGWCTLGQIQTEAREFFCARLNIDLSMKLTDRSDSLYKEIEGCLEALNKAENDR